VRSQREFEEEEDAIAEYHQRLARYERATSRTQGGEPPKRIKKPWIAPTGPDAFFEYQGIVQEVLPRERHVIVAIAEMENTPLQYYWHDNDPPLSPGDGIVYNHDFRRREGLFALRVLE